MNEPRQHCVDKLLLVTEMLQAATEYLTVCRSLLDDEDNLMARLAYEQILNLRNRVAHVDRKIDGLEAELRRRLTESASASAAAMSKGAAGVAR
jgi:uncharacterized protein Yka (UPF0111/DUF47 family)